MLNRQDNPWSANRKTEMFKISSKLDRKMSLVEYATQNEEDNTEWATWNEVENIECDPQNERENAECDPRNEVKNTECDTRKVV